MRKLNKVTAVVLAGCMLLPGIGASADNEAAKSVVITGIDRRVTITAEKTILRRVKMQNESVYPFRIMQREKSQRLWKHSRLTRTKPQI